MRRALFFFSLAAIFWLAGTGRASAQNVTTIVQPNGGECLTVGQSNTVTFSWSGPDIEHVALYYRTDGQQPSHLDASLIKHPINVPGDGTSWSWVPGTQHISETGRIWVDGHDHIHNSLNTWDSSDANFYVRSSCAVPASSGGNTNTFLTPPSISALKVSGVTTSSAVISWTTDQYSYYKFSYGESSGNYSREISTGPPMADSASHKVTLTNLAENTAYYFKIATGIYRPVNQESQEYSFKTLDATPPAQVKDIFGIAGASTTLLSWVNPPDLDFKETVITRRTDHFAENRSDGSAIFVGENTYYTDGGITNGTNYYYSIFTADVNGNVGKPVNIKLTPQADLPRVPTPPKVATASSTLTAIRVGNLRSRAEENTIFLDWLNSKDPNFLGVQIVRNFLSLPAHAYDGEVVWRGRAESFKDTGLLTGRRYNYGLFAFDWKNNFYSPAFITETTGAVKGVVEKPASRTEEVKAAVKILKLGSKGEEVKTLQEFLSKYPDLYPQGLITGYFGRFTRIAVQRFQIKYNIASSGDETTTGFGSVGPKTREKLDLLASEAAKKQETVSQEKPEEGVYNVLILSYGFSPKIITIPLGSTVNWLNQSGSESWVASDPHPVHNLYPGFDVKHGIKVGETFSFVFTKAGSWGYHDHLDPVKTGDVIVK